MKQPTCKRLLLIDDNLEDWEILKYALKKSGYSLELLHEPNSEKAISRLASGFFSSIDLIILDWNMPRISGLECLERIRGIPSYASIPVVMFSGAISTASMEEAKHLGVSYFLHKPDDLHEFGLRLEEMFAAAC